MKPVDYDYLPDIKSDAALMFEASYAERITDDLSTAHDYYLCLDRNADLYFVWGDAPQAKLRAESRGEIERLRFEILHRESPDTLYVATDFAESLQIVKADFSAVSDEMLQYCASHPEVLQSLHWREFEKLLASLFKKMGYETELGPGSGDGGVDLRLIWKDSVGALITLVQAKRFKADNPISLCAVQALYGAVTDQLAIRGLFVTTSRYLPCAREFANRQHQRLILADSSDVARWCKTVVANRKGHR